MTSEEIVYHQRVRMLDHARLTQNVSETCRVFGVSRKTFYKWRNIAATYGLAALWPKNKRPPAMPNATPTHVIKLLLTLAVTLPTVGCRQYADQLAERGFQISKSTVQYHLVTHDLGKRHQRLARTVAIAAMTTGTIISVTRDPEPFGFYHWAPAPGALVSVDSFYIGNLKGVDKVHQLTAVDTFTRWATVWIIAGTVNAELSVQFLGRMHRCWARLRYAIRAVVADNGPEYKASLFCEALADKIIERIWIPLPSGYALSDTWG